MKRIGPAFFLALVAIVFCACSQHNLGTFVLTSPSPVLDRIQQRGELVVATAAGMPPLNMTTRDGKIIGLDADLSRFLADAMEVSLRLEPMAFSDLLPALEAGKVDMVISGVTITVRRNRRVAFVGPYLISGKGLLTREARLAAIKGPDGINRAEVRLTALKGSTSADFIKTVAPRAQFLPVQTYCRGGHNGYRRPGGRHGGRSTRLPCQRSPSCEPGAFGPRFSPDLRTDRHCAAGQRPALCQPRG
ncbi:MAG: transporter substrate-binding domain-containing protein [Deltaproteobacteria bacterium]|nr:transporter substrate-binding domain-containing protein [Deltaproteobacteria bacterium]